MEYKRRLVHLDTNRINARQKDAFVNQLEALHQQGIIELMMSRAAYQEASHGSLQRAKKAEEYYWLEANGGVSSELERTIFPRGCVNQNQRNDVAVALAAQQTRALLVTADGDLLVKANELMRFGLHVVTAEQAIALIAADGKHCGG